MGRLYPSGFPTVVRTAASLRLMHGSLMSWVSPRWNWGCGLETTFLICYYCLGVEARGLHAPIVPPPTVPPPPRSSLPLGIKRGHPSGIGAFMVSTPGDTRGRSTFKVGQRPRPWTLTKLPLLLCSTSGGFLALGPTMLTLVNARGPYGTASVLISDYSVKKCNSF